MAFKLERFGSNSSNVKNMFGGTNDYRYYNKDNNILTTPGYFPSTLGLEVGDRIKVTPSVKTNPDETYIVTDTTNGVVTVTKVDTDGAVDSVNGKTGAVVLGASDVGAVPQLSELPTASADNEGQVVQFVGTTGTYTNGYFYKCVSDGQNPATYSWTQVSVQPAPSGLPDQTGQSGKFLTTDGTNASWSDKPLANEALSQGSISVGVSVPAVAQRTVAIGDNIGGNFSIGDSVTVGSSATNSHSWSVVIGSSAGAWYNGDSGVAIGYSARANGKGAIAIGRGAQITAYNAILLNASGDSITNSDANTFKVANANGNFEIMSANGTIPADRLGDTTGLNAGNYRPRLTIDAQGNKTITWVAE